MTGSFIASAAVPLRQLQHPVFNGLVWVQVQFTSMKLLRGWMLLLHLQVLMGHKKNVIKVFGPACRFCFYYYATLGNKTVPSRGHLIPIWIWSFYKVKPKLKLNIIKSTIEMKKAADGAVCLNWIQHNIIPNIIICNVKQLHKWWQNSVRSSNKSWSPLAFFHCHHHHDITIIQYPTLSQTFSSFQWNWKGSREEGRDVMDPDPAEAENFYCLAGFIFSAPLFIFLCEVSTQLSIQKNGTSCKVWKRVLVPSHDYIAGGASLQFRSGSGKLVGFFSLWEVRWN